jgi:hypothetical protein
MVRKMAFAACLATLAAVQYEQLPCGFLIRQSHAGPFFHLSELTLQLAKLPVNFWFKCL